MLDYIILDVTSSLIYRTKSWTLDHCL